MMNINELRGRQAIALFLAILSSISAVSTALLSAAVII
jgi:hypothetical protein